MRILWTSNSPWTQTGYGNQTRLFATRIAQQLGHELAIHAFYGLQGGPLTANGLPIFPAVHPDYGQTDLARHAKSWGADLVIPFMDVWVAKPFLYDEGTRWAPWFPIDHEPCPPPILAALRGGDVDASLRRPCFRPLVYSRFAERMLADAGVECRYVPHGVDTAVYSPGDKAASRAKVGLPADRYIVGMVAANKGGGAGLGHSRKAFPQQIEAFARFKMQHPDAFLYLHTLNGLGGGDLVNLVELCQYHGLTEGDFGFPDQHQYAIGVISDPMMATVYRSLDALLSVSMGEGFGIPILEAQASGCPVIVGDWTSMSELKWHGWTVAREDAERVWTPMGAYQFLPHISAIVERLEAAYAWRGGTPARLKDVIATYDADWITRTYWKPVLDEIASDLGLPATVEPSKRLVLPANGTVPPGIDGLNRAQRRQLQRVK